MIDKSYKYKFLFEKHNIDGICPGDEATEVETDAFRWTYSEIDNELNFLPKFLYDEKKGMPTRFNSTDDLLKCSCCGLSMFKSIDYAKSKFNNIPLRSRKLLGYTSIAFGKINNTLGTILTFNSSEHLDLFEYENVDLSKVFKIIDNL